MRGDSEAQTSGRVGVEKKGKSSLDIKIGELAAARKQRESMLFFRNAGGRYRKECS